MLKKPKSDNSEADWSGLYFATMFNNDKLHLPTEMYHIAFAINFAISKCNNQLFNGDGPAPMTEQFS